MSTKKPTIPATPSHIAERCVPPAGAPPGRSRAGLALAAVVLGVAVLAGCGGSGPSASLRCSGTDCRATVTGAPVEVSQSTRTTTTRRGPSTTRRTVSSRDGVDFTVSALGPGWVEIADDGPPVRVPVGGTITEDGSPVRVESSDGRTATLSFRGR